MVILGYWEAPTPKNGEIDDATTFNVMWQRLTSKYAGDNAVHFEPMNEPFGYTSQQWTDIVRHLPRAATDRLRQLHMGSVYWPGLRTGDTFSLTAFQGGGTALSCGFPALGIGMVAYPPPAVAKGVAYLPPKSWPTYLTAAVRAIAITKSVAWPIASAAHASGRTCGGRGRGFDAVQGRAFHDPVWSVIRPSWERLA
jgi:Cellulase (glycosyl hydrolase family 5)